MASLNKVQLIGFVGADPETKEFTGGGMIAKFNVATTESYMDKSNKRVENTEWHKCVIHGNLAKYVAENVKKGYQVYVEGKMKTRNFEDKDTKRKVYITEVVAGMPGTSVVILGRKDADVLEVKEQ